MALTVLVLNGSLFRNLTRLTLVSYRSASPALSQARRGPTHPVTVMFYTPRGRAAIRNPVAIALDRRLVRLSRHLVEECKLRGRAVESYVSADIFYRQDW